jgi:hypothetical protein
MNRIESMEILVRVNTDATSRDSAAPILRVNTCEYGDDFHNRVRIARAVAEFGGRN